MLSHQFDLDQEADQYMFNSLSVISLCFLFLFSRQHRGKVIGVTFSPSGEQLYSAGSLGSLALYDSKDNGFPLLRLLSNMLARGEKRAPNALTVSPDGLFLAFVGPTEFTICVTDARSLDEVQHSH